MAYWTRLLPIALALAGFLRAAPHRMQVYPNSSIIIRAIVEGADGLLWLAAEDGLYRFNGVNYRKAPGYPFATAEFLSIAADGALWIGSREGLVRYSGDFRVITRKGVKTLATEHDYAFIVIEEAGVGAILARIDVGGQITPYEQIHPRGDLTTDSSGAIWFVQHGSRDYAVRWNSDFPERSQWLEIPADFKQGVPDNSGRLWVADGATAMALADRREVHRIQQTVDRPGPLLTGKQGRLWFLGDTVEDLSTGLRFIDRPQNSAYPPTAGLEDSRGRLWVAEAGRGLVAWDIDPTWERWYRSDLGDRAAAQVLRLNRDGIALTHGGFLRLNEGKREWVSMKGPPDSYDAALAIPGGEMLAASRTQGIVRLDGDGRVMERIPSPPLTLRDFRIIARDRAGRVWIGNKQSLFTLAGSPGAYRLKAETLPGAPISAGAVDFQVDEKDRLWVGYEKGLAWLDERGAWHLVAPEGLEQVRSFALAGDAIWVAKRTPGAFFHLKPHGDSWSVSRFDAREGFGPADTLFLKRDSRGWIWRGTTDGVRVCDGVHLGPQDWLRLDASNGFASGEADINGFFEDEDHSVWLSGDQGVTHIHPDSSWFGSPPGAPEASVIERTRNILRVEMASMASPHFRDAPWRYRTSSTEEWRYSRDGVIEVRDRFWGGQTLEVAYVGGSIPAMIPLRTGFGLTRWWLALTVPLIAAGWLRWRLGAEWLEEMEYRARKLWFVVPRRLAKVSKFPETKGDEPADLSGTLLMGRFSVSRAIAHSAFSTVYEGLDRWTGGKIAIKQLRGTGSLEPGKRMRDRFAKEVFALRSVHHPNIVPVIDSWIDSDGNGCLAMPFLEGPTLRHEFVREKTWAPSRVARMVRSIGLALTEIHKRGIVHRDLKPENIILVNDGDGEEPVLIDFGIAGLRAGPNDLSMTRTFAGSLQYMAPEGLSGHYSSASDLYSLAVITLEALTGKRRDDFEADVSDEGFLQELRIDLQRVTTETRAEELAALLARSFTPAPGRRPEVRWWTETVANLLADPAG